MGSPRCDPTREGTVPTPAGTPAVAAAPDVAAVNTAPCRGTHAGIPAVADTPTAADDDTSAAHTDDDADAEETYNQVIKEVKGEIQSV